VAGTRLFEDAENSQNIYLYDPRGPDHIPLFHEVVGLVSSCKKVDTIFGILRKNQRTANITKLSGKTIAALRASALAYS
jgi:hypothetical protein